MYEICMVKMCIQFKRMLSRELTQFAESGKMGTQISEYICHTFLGTFMPAYNRNGAISAARDIINLGLLSV